MSLLAQKIARVVKWGTKRAQALEIIVSMSPPRGVRFDPTVHGATAAELTEDIGCVNRMSVYTMLGILEKAGLIQRLEDKRDKNFIYVAKPQILQESRTDGQSPQQIRTPQKAQVRRHQAPRISAPQRPAQLRRSVP